MQHDIEDHDRGLARDMVFGDNSAAQLAQQTPTMTGSVPVGYVATAVIGIAL